MAIKNKYAVALLSTFDANNKIIVVEATNEVEALKLASIEFNGTTEEQKRETQEWIEKIITLDELLNELANGEILASNPLLLNIKTEEEERNLKFLKCLNAVGVDNWEGYESACDKMEEEG